MPVLRSSSARRVSGRALRLISFIAFTALPLAAQQPLDSARADSARADSVRADSLRADSLRADSLRADSLRAHTARRTAQLEPVQVVAVPADRREPVSATHVSELTVRQTPAQNAWDLLRQTAGIEVHQQAQGPGFASDASVRGFSSDHSTDLALWVDGVPINEPINGHAEGYNDWSVVFPGGIQDIDVIKGPTSALFGNFALAGVVNVRTRERMRGTELTVTGGSFGRADAMLMTGFDHGPMGGGIFGIHLQREDGFRPNSGYDLGHAHARVVHDLSPSVRIDAGAELYASRWDSPGFLSESEFAQHQYDIVSNPTDGGFRRRAQERVSLRVLSGTTLWRTTLYSTQGQWQLFLTIPPAGGRFEGSGSQTREDDDRSGYGLTSAVTAALPNGEITFGTEAQLARSHFQNWFTTARMRDSAAEVVSARQLSGALFVQAHDDITDRLRIDAGARYDALHTRSLPELDGDAPLSAGHGVFTPKAGALLRLTHDIGLFGNVSRGFRSSDGIISDPTLPFITEWAYESGLKLDHGPVLASVALFRMNVSNEQSFNPLTSGSTSGGSSRRQGVELDWRTPVAPRVTLSGNWTFLDARYKQQTLEPEDPSEPPAVLDGLRVYNTAKYVGDAALEYSPAPAWRLRLSGNFVGPYSPFDEPGVLLPAYGLLHLGGIAMVRGTEIDFGIRNLLDRAYPELVAGHIVAPGQPLSFFVTARRML